MQKGSYNEQYSRKSNIKIMDVTEEHEETAEILTDNILTILYRKAGVAVDPRNIVAIHRFPGKAGKPKPVLIKMLNNHETTKIMKKRKVMKTREHNSAWFFNGSVFGKTTEENRHKFDVFSDIGRIIRKADAADEGSSK